MAKDERPLERMYDGHGTYKGLHRVHRVAGSFPVEMARAEKADFRDTEPATHCFSPGVTITCLSVDPVVTVCWGGPRHRLPLTETACYVHPTTYDTDYEMTGRASLLALAVPLDRMAEAVEMDVPELVEGIEPLYERLFEDPLYRRLGLDMWELGLEADRQASLFIDHSMMTMALTAIQNAHGDAWSRKQDRTSVRTLLSEPDSPLESRRLKRVVDFIEENFAEPLTNAQLASEAALSEHHFIKRFQAATGETPHRYVMARRLNAAKDLMRGTRLDLTSVALACGFNSHAHLSRHFRQEVGITPSEWRQKHRDD